MPKRMTAFFCIRRFPGPAWAWLAALMLVLACQDVLAGSLVWNPIGYGGGGRFTTAVVDPQTPSDIIIGSDVAGFFTSADEGHTFHLRGAGLGGLAVAGFALDGPSRLLVLTDNGLFSSTDGGRSMTPVSQQIRYSSRFFGSSLFARLDNGLYVATSMDGVFKLTHKDAGGWTIKPVFGLQGKKVNALQTTQGKLVAATDEGIYFYTGEYWKLQSEGLPPNRRDVMDLASHPSGRLYALERQTGLYVFNPDGTTWTRRGPNLASLPSQNGPPTFKALAVSPANPDIVFIGTHPKGWPHLLLRSTDGGRNWTLINHFALRGQNDNWAKGLQSQEQIVFAPDGKTAYLLDWWNVWRSADGGISWIQVQDGLQNTVVNDIAVHPANPARIYAAVDDNGLMVSSDGGQSWSRKMQGVIEGHAGAVALSAKDPSLVYLLVNPWHGEDTDTDKYFYLYKSRDGGNSWSRFRLHDQKRPAVKSYADGRGTNVVISPRDDNVVFVTTNGYGIYKVDTTNAPQGQDAPATNVSTGLASLCIKGQGALQVDPRNPDIMVVATQEGGLFRTTDGGNNWELAGAPRGFVFGMARDPAHPDTLYATAAEKRLLKSTDNGVTWTWLDLPGEHPAYIAAAAVTVVPGKPGTPGTLLVGTSAYDNKAADGLYVSRNGGDSFSQGPGGLPGVGINVLTAYPRGQKLALAGFNGIGLYALSSQTDTGKP